MKKAEKNEAYTTALKNGALRHVIKGARPAPAACSHRQKHPPLADEGADDSGTVGGEGGGGFALAPADRGGFVEYDH